MLNSKKVEKVQTIYGAFHCWENDLITKQLKQYSAHTRNELAMIKSLIQDGDNIIDIGAHIGTFSIPFAKFNGKKGRVFSFEANQDNYELLEKNISENSLEKVIIPDCALVSLGKREFGMVIPNSGNSGMYYFLPDSQHENDDVKVINIDNWHAQLENETEIKLMKVDVEGAEALVLRASEALIKKYKPMLYIEISQEQLERFNDSITDIDEILKMYGYHYFKNIGARNSDNDKFKIARLNNINKGGEFFDLLAIHPSDSRYPEQYVSQFQSGLYQKKNRLVTLFKRFTKRLIGKT
jgi:FkbM family methyltransferase